MVLLADGSPDAADVMALSVATAAMALAPAGWAIHRKLRGLDHEPLRVHNPLEPSMWLVTVGRALLSQLDLLLVGVLATSADVATYAVPFRLALFVGFPLIVVNQVVPPLDRELARRRGGRATRAHPARPPPASRSSARCVIAAVYVVGGTTHHQRAVRREVRGRLHRPAHPHRGPGDADLRRARAGSR